MFRRRRLSGRYHVHMPERSADDPEVALDAILKSAAQHELERRHAIPLTVEWRQGDTPVEELRVVVGSPQRPVRVTIGGDTDWFIIKSVFTGGPDATIEAIRCQPPE